MDYLFDLIRTSLGLYANWAVLWGLGMPLRFELRLTIWPCGDNGLSGIGRGRFSSYHVIEV